MRRTWHESLTLFPMVNLACLAVISVPSTHTGLMTHNIHLCILSGFPWFLPHFGISLSVAKLATVILQSHPLSYVWLSICQLASSCHVTPGNTTRSSTCILATNHHVCILIHLENTLLLCCTSSYRKQAS